MNNLEYKTLDNLIENELKMQTQRFEQKQQEIIKNSLKEKDKEIERLNARVKECEEAYLRTRHQYSELEGKYVINDHIINELEKWLEEVFIKMKEKQVEIGGRGYYYTDLIPIEDVLNKLKELKEKK